jgi:acyl-CoA synthetase (AMP-forming)/AMP-acid ligase II/1-acyl-sn-glycerol-3-phosphate acyltransferase/acyl carrier protein
MLKNILHLLLLFLLSLRYRITVKGLEEIRSKGTDSIVFMPNHPALIDPVILMSRLHRGFAPRPLADEGQVDRSFVRPLMKSLRAVVIPDLSKDGKSGKKAVLAGVQGIIDGLQQGDNILLYPAGRIYRSRYESIGATSSVGLVLKRVPKARVVLVRSTGLWGSSFSRAQGSPSLTRNIRLYLRALLSAGLFFLPKREVEIEFLEPENFPRDKNKLQINGYLEEFFNKQSQANTHVPYYWWQGKAAKQIAEPRQININDDTSHIPVATKELVLQKIKDLCGVETINQGDKLAQDLGMDSLVLVEYVVWLEQEFGVVLMNLDGLQTVAHCILAAAGEFSGLEDDDNLEVDPGWFADTNKKNLQAPAGDTVAELFLQQALRHPKKVIVTDQISGAKTYRQLLTAIFALQPEFEKLTGAHIGIMLPATVSAAISYFSTIFAGKTPVMVNWTVGAANMDYCLKNAEVTHVITAKALYEKVKGQGVDLDSIGVHFIFLEELAASLSTTTKLQALFKARFSVKQLQKAAIRENAAILFTSGSESHPKTVPLSHANFLANIADFTSVLTLNGEDRLLGMLPPFHSLGLAGTLIMPLVMALPVVYSPNPTEGALLAKICEAHKVTLLIGTPTFLNGIANGLNDKTLDHVRIAFTGAEKCQPYVYKALETSFPQVTVCEGYGITECSPVVSINDPQNPTAGTIGRILPSMEYALVHPETGEAVKKGETGRLLLRGPNVFSGYLHYQGKSPFENYQDKEWYNSGDLVQDNDGILTFAGRLKRFIKLGGEMISLPAIEEVLVKQYQTGDEPVLAVSSTPGDDHPEIILFTTGLLSRENANISLRQHGFSPLHNIRRIVEVDEIPVLGTGKTDYRTLDTQLMGTELS